MLNPDNRTVDRSIQNSEIAYAGASFMEEFEFPAPVQAESPRNSSTATGANGESAESKGSGGLSKGAKIGIGIGAAIVGLILLGALVTFFIVRRHRASQKTRHHPRGGLARPEYPMSEFTPSQKDLTSNAAPPGLNRF